MTREEAKQSIDYYYCHTELLDEYGDYCDQTEYEEAFDMAIKALEQEPETVTEFADRCHGCGAKYGKLLKQEPCDDAISRQAVLNAMYDLCDTDETLKENPWRDNPHIDAITDAIDDLPSVTPQTRTGRWILADEQNKEDVENDNYRFICSECQCSDIHAKDAKVPYCWKCGAKMVEPQGSEVQE